MQAYTRRESCASPRRPRQPSPFRAFLVAGLLVGLCAACTADVDLRNADSTEGDGSGQNGNLLCHEPAVEVRKFSEFSTTIRVTLDVLGNPALQAFPPHGCHCSFKEGEALRAVRAELTLFDVASAGAEARCEIGIGKVTAPFDLGCRVIHGLQEQRIIGLSKWYRVSPAPGDEETTDKSVVDDRGISLTRLADVQSGWGDLNCGIPRELPDSGLGGNAEAEDEDSFESIFGSEEDDSAPAASETPDALDQTTSEASASQNTSLFPVIGS